MGQANKFITNVLATYVRMALTIGIGLLTTRLLFDMLGAVDFGLYFVLGGGISLIMVISSALSDAAQRHMAFEIGRGDEIALRQVFATSVIIYLGLGVVITGVGLALRPAFLYGLTIPEERFQAAAWVYDLALLNMSLSVLATPFLAVFLARQAMVQDAVFALLNSVASLVAVLLAPRIHADVLIGYAMLIAASRLIFMALQILRGLILFPETRFRIKHVKRNRMRELVGFAGWSFLGSLAWQLRIQGGQIVLNLFFGPSVNAAFAISNQVGVYMNNFCGTITKAARPVVVSFEGGGRDHDVKRMVFSVSKLTLLASSIIAIPLIIFSKEVLDLWLGSVPQYASEMLMFVILTTMITLSASGHAMALAAKGNIGKTVRYTFWIVISPLPVSYIMYSMDVVNPLLLLQLYVGASAVSAVFRAWYIGRMIDSHLKDWLLDTILPSAVVIGLASLPLTWLSFLFDINSVWIFGLFVILHICSTISFSVFIALSTNERQLLMQFTKTIRSKFTALRD